MQRIEDLTQVFPHAAQDIRGFGVIAREGIEVGRVKAMFLDEHQRKVRFLEVVPPSPGAPVLVPVDAITDIGEHQIHIGQSAAQVWSSPPYQPAYADPQGYWEQVYHHYGYLPHWFADNIFPGYPSR